MTDGHMMGGETNSEQIIGGHITLWKEAKQTDHKNRRIYVDDTQNDFS